LPEDGKIDWKDTNENVIRLINASSEPYSGAFCEYEGEKMIIWRAELYEDDENYLAISGQVAEIKHDSGNVVIITGQGKILLQEVEYKGKRSKPNNFIKSIRKRLK
jgi:UDP-4-amino-4-deoxy-L-arabinose formyltransferase/UDP-glucuronic acid dehydrogenase (UDP-4-keto-hexauronic acid decarboxylating)